MGLIHEEKTDWISISNPPLLSGHYETKDSSGVLGIAEFANDQWPPEEHANFTHWRGQLTRLGRNSANRLRRVLLNYKNSKLLEQQSGAGAAALRLARHLGGPCGSNNVPNQAKACEFYQIAATLGANLEASDHEYQHRAWTGLSLEDQKSIRGRADGYSRK